MATPDPTLPPPAISILLLEGDAEARLLLDAEAACLAVFAGREVAIRRTWSTRPEWLDADGPALPPALVGCGAVPDLDVRALLAQPPQLVILALLPVVMLPGLRHSGGGALLAPHALRAGWSPDMAARIDADCTQEPPLSPEHAAAAFEPHIVSLQERGAAVALCTAFRHVRLPADEYGRTEARATRETIRRLNLEVARLSRRTGCFVLDLDRPLAQEGGAALGADYLGGDGRAAEIALDEFAALLLEALPDEIMSLEFM